MIAPIRRRARARLALEHQQPVGAHDVAHVGDAAAGRHAPAGHPVAAVAPVAGDAGPPGAGDGAVALPRAAVRAVRAVLSLIYNAGADDVRRRDLRAEAIWLTRVLVALMPDEPEALGLLALLLLHDARREARGGGAPRLRGERGRKGQAGAREG